MRFLGAVMFSIALDASTLWIRAASFNESRAAGYWIAKAS
jgi:hypothetical protein